MVNLFSLNKKLVISFLIAGVLPALCLSYIIVNKVTIALGTEAQEKLVSLREGKGFQLEQMYKTMGGQVSALSQNRFVQEASVDFSNAFKSYKSESREKFDIAKSRLKNFYIHEFGKKYESTNVNREFNHLKTTFSKLNKTKILLQDAFISKNQNALGEKDQLYDLRNGTTYSKVHSQFHGTFKTYLAEFGYYDIFLADAKSGNIIYSVYKELDFATSLKSGPYSKTGIGEAFRGAMEQKSKGKIFFTDVGKYFPSYDAPAQFISAPVYRNDKKIAILIFQIPIEKVNKVLTSNNEWERQGQGVSGETYIIGKNKSMKSISRFIVEDSDRFLAKMQKSGMDKSDIDYMKSHETSVLAAKINTKGADSAILGKTGFEIFSNYRDVNVLSAYRPLNISGLEWYILSEMDEVEALSSLRVIKEYIYISIISSVILIFILSLTFSKKISRSLISLAEKLKIEAEGILKLANSLVSNSSTLAKSSQQQASSLHETSASVNEISVIAKKNLKTASCATELSAETQLRANEGKQCVDNVKLKIEAIHSNNINLARSVDESNKEIESIIEIISNIERKTKVINDIAFQTKLLSFNASVEAARAGEHGKGFSVVAEEIASLADVSTESAAEITTLLEQSIFQVKETVESTKSKVSETIKFGEKSVNDSFSEIHTCEEALSKIINHFQEVNESVQEIASCSSEQSIGVNEIATAVEQIDIISQNTNAMVSETLEKADYLKEKSSNLSFIINDIQSIVFGQSKKTMTNTLLSRLDTTCLISEEGSR